MLPSPPEASMWSNPQPIKPRREFPRRARDGRRDSAATDLRVDLRLLDEPVVVCLAIPLADLNQQLFDPTRGGVTRAQNFVRDLKIE
jgi:hypothetical protein